ncbi:MAG: radical SAM protein, partial [Legionellales bacterium]|nr:radical SAM protein [Legionellales bacterium]
MNDLKLTEIFYSLQGESTLVGLPTVFVRLTGCPLRCQYCDTAYAFHGGKRWSFADILAEIAQYRTRYVTVTGGEPLAQKNCLPLLTQLCDADYRVSLETSGALSVAKVDPRVIKVMDIKTPASGEESGNLLLNLNWLQSHDQL